MRPTDEELALRAAIALDESAEAYRYRPRAQGPRQRVTEALDAGERPRLEDVRWLEQVARFGFPDDPS